MQPKPIDALFALALAVGAAYFSNRWTGVNGAWTVAEKGVCLALLALWAAARARGSDRRLIVSVLALGALGDVLIEGSQTAGALAFLAGHIVAVVLYVRNRRATIELAVPVAIVVAMAAWLLPADRSAATGVAVYALGLGAMAGTALNSRFPRETVGMGALLFVASDLLIFARMGPLHASAVPDLLVWPLYVAGQALIAWGVVTTLAKERP